MSFSYRDKPRLSERLRGKSGDEILNELKEQFDQDRKMFFDTNPNWRSPPMTSSFSRTGFPFDDDMMRGRQDIRSHLDDLAQRHPEFADHLRCPPWGGELGGTRTWGRKRRGSGSGDDDSRSQASGASSSSNEQTVPDNQEQNDEPGPLRGRGRQGNLPQYGLRNTVDLGKQQQHETEQEKQGRGQRSMSAPPDNRSQPQRFVSRIDINPVNPADPTSGGGPQTVTSNNYIKPPVAPKQSQQQTCPQSTPSKQSQASNVRHIPIFVEGRDEPVLPKNIETENVDTSRMEQPQQSFGRPPQFATPRQFYPQQQQQATSTETKNFQQHPSSPKQCQTKSHSVPQPQPSKPQVPTNDPINRVQAVQKDVEALKDNVEKFDGKSRKDKEYVYLDEMLTRNLLKLDDIDTEGKDNVRQARKEAIRTIQRCISILEAKVPINESNNLSGEVAMETESIKQNDVIEPNEPISKPTEATMEVIQTEDTAKEQQHEADSDKLLNASNSNPSLQVNKNINEEDLKVNSGSEGHEQVAMDVDQQNLDVVESQKCTEVKDGADSTVSENNLSETDQSKAASDSNLSTDATSSKTAPDPLESS